MTIEVGGEKLREFFIRLSDCDPDYWVFYDMSNIDSKNLTLKFPKKRWKEIERAEKNDDEGNRIYKNLKAEYLDKYMPKPDADPHSLSTGPENFKKIENPYFGSAPDEMK